MNLVVSPVWSSPTVILVTLGLLALVLTTYPSRVRHLPVLQRRTLIGLRLAAVAVLFFAMLRPEVVHSETSRQRAVLIVLGDASRSMNTPDGPGAVTRRQALLKELAGVTKLFDALGDDVEIRYFDFATDLAPVKSLVDRAEGDETALGAVLERVGRLAQTERIAGVVLLSDGAQRARQPTADPRAIAKELGALQIPVYTVWFGGTGFSENAIELAIEELLVDPVVFEKKVVTVTARIRVHGVLKRPLKVRLLVEDRAGRKQGESGEMKVPSATANTKPQTTITADRNGQVIPVELSYVPNRPGEFKIAVEVESPDGELQTRNNRRETIITVRQGGLNVAYYDRVLRPEQKFIRLINRSENIQMDFYPVRSGQFTAETRIENESFQAGRYDVYVIGDVPAGTFSPNQLRALAERVREGAGFLMTGGYHNFGAGGYAGTPLADLLPVEMRDSDIVKAGEVSPEQHHFKPLQMLPTARGEQQHYVMRLDVPSKNRDRWKSLPPLQGGNRLKAKTDAVVETLAVATDGTPLLLAHEVGQARVMAFAGDTTYQWVLTGHKSEHQRFWRQMILYLARKEFDTDQPVWVRIDPRNYMPKQRVALTFGARTDEGKPLPDADFTVDVSHTRIDPKTKQPRKSDHRPQPRRSGDESTAEFLNTADAGDYWVRVTAKHDGKPLGYDAWTRFIVDARDPETDNPAADHALLKDIAELSGGTAMPPEGLSSLLGRMLKEGVGTAEITQVTRTRLWDNWPFLGLFVAVMSMEWLLRKKRGLV
jgi:uncharacterized membrane protein